MTNMNRAEIIKLAIRIVGIAGCYLPQYCHAYGYYRGNQQTSDPAMQKLIKLKEQEVRIEQEKLEIQKEKDRQSYIVDIKAEDERLQQEALLRKDGRCADYFDSTRCRRPATHEGFCAKHYREIDKNVKDERYKVIAIQRIGVRKVRAKNKAKQ